MLIQIAGILSAYPGEFELVPEHIGSFKYTPNNLNFCIIDRNKHEYNKPQRFVLNIYALSEKTNYNDVQQFIEKLSHIGVISLINT